MMRFTDEDCDSLSERRCAPRVAEELLRLVRIRLAGADEIYIAEARWEERLSNRMSQRRHARRFNTFTYRDVDGMVWYFADGPIGGREPPVSSRQVSLDEADERLVSMLWIPGHVEHSFSEGWTFPRSRTAQSGLHISLDGLSDDQVSEFRCQADETLKAEGVHPGDPVPPELWVPIRGALLAIRDDLLGGD